MKDKTNKYDNANMVRLGSNQNKLIDNSVKRITNLHNEIKANLEDSFEKAVKIGELLTKEKEKLGHGNFTEWVESNLPFKARQARKYMQIFDNKDVLGQNGIFNADLKSIDDMTKSLSRIEKEVNNEPEKKLNKKQMIEKLKNDIESLRRKLDSKIQELAELENS